MEEGHSRRNRKKQATRQRLMDAALQSFCECGYDATTIEEITRMADVAKGTFFNYFETKEAIVPALARWRFQRLEEALSSNLSDVPDSPVERIKLALSVAAQDPLAHPVLARRLFSAAAQQQDVHPDHALANLLATQIRCAQTTGEIRADLDPVYLAEMIRVLFFHQLISWHDGVQSISLSEQLASAVDVLLDGIAGPKWRTSS